MRANNSFSTLTLLFSVVFLTILTISVPCQSGGQFTIEQSVIANSGGTSAGGAYTVAGTNAQSIAGTNSSNPRFGLHGGFWNAEPLSTSAAWVSVGGRVMTSGGAGIRNVRVSLTDTGGHTRTSVTGTFGYYIFDDVEAGQVVIVSVASKRFAFAQSSIVLNLLGPLTDADFIANP